MATPSHTTMLREISAAGDSQRTGVLEIAWDGAHANLFFMFGHPSHVVYESSDGRTLAGDEALTALVAELPAEFQVAPWRRVMVTEDTLQLTAEALIALFNDGAPAIYNGHATPDPGSDGAGAISFDGGADPPADADEAVDAGSLTPPVPPAYASRPAFGMRDFPLLPVGPVLWSDDIANVVNLEAAVPRLPDCLLVLARPDHRAAALVADGAIADAVWMAGDRGLLGDDAAVALMTSREGNLIAYRIDDPGIVAALPSLWRGTRIADDRPEGRPHSDDVVAEMRASRRTCALIVEAEENGVALFAEGELVAVYTTEHRWPVATMTALRTLLQEPGARVTIAGEVSAPRVSQATVEPGHPIAGARAAEAALDSPTTDQLASSDAGTAGPQDAPPSNASDHPALVGADSGAGENALTWSFRESATPPSARLAMPIDREQVELPFIFSDQYAAPAPPPQPVFSPQPRFGPVGRSRSPRFVPVLSAVTLGVYALVWHHRINRELDDFDPTLHARPLRSTLATAVPWLVGLLATLTGAVLLVTARLNNPLNSHVTSAQAYLLLAGLALVPYLILILPFSVVAVVMTLERLRCVEEHLGLTTDRQVRPVPTSLLLAVPVIGGLLLLRVEQERINAIWDAQGAGAAPALEREPSLELAARAAYASDEPVEVAEAVEDETADVAVAIHDEPEPEADEPATETTAAAVDVEPAADADAIDDEPAPEADAVEEEPSADAAAETVDDEPTAAEDAAAEEVVAVADDIDDQPAEVAEAVEDEPEAGGGDADEPATEAEAVEEETAVTAWVETPTHLDGDADLQFQPAVFSIAAMHADGADPVAVEHREAGQEIEFIPTRLAVDVDGLRAELTAIAVTWLGDDDAAPVAKAIAAARPGVDDFVSTIATISVMEISGQEPAVVRAMAREMHYRASEVLCGV